MRDEKGERKKQAIKVKQTNKVKQHSTPKAVTFPKKNELPQVGLEPTCTCTLYDHAKRRKNKQLQHLKRRGLHNSTLYSCLYMYS